MFGPTLTELVDLPGFLVRRFEKTEIAYFLSLESITEEASCPRCAMVSDTLHQNHYYLVRDLSLSGRETWLRLNRRQFRCLTCSKPFSEEFLFVDKHRPYTKRFAKEIMKQVMHSNYATTARNNNLTEERVSSIVEYIAKMDLVINIKGLKRLGIDEISLHKGQKDYVAVLVDLDTKKPIDIVKSRKQEDIREVLESWGTEILEQVVEVSMDMWKAYKSLVEELMPEAAIVVDRFHVMKAVNEELDAARRAVKKEGASLKKKKSRSRLKSP